MYRSVLALLFAAVLLLSGCAAGRQTVPKEKSGRETNMDRASFDRSDEEITYMDNMIKARIRPYFAPLGLQLREVTPQHIEDFYQSILADDCTTNTVIHYHAIIRKALQTAVKKDIHGTGVCLTPGLLTFQFRLNDHCESPPITM